MTNKVLLVAVLLLMVGSSLATANVVAFKRDAALTDGRGLDATFAAAITNGTATVYSGAGAVGDAYLWTDAGYAQSLLYVNSGAATKAPSGAPILLKFGLNALSGFVGGTINKAELRFYTFGGNSGTAGAGYITTSDWSEGNKGADPNANYGWGDFPGLPASAAGVTGAAPSAVNTAAFQMPDGTAVDVGWPPDMSKAPLSWANGQAFAAAKDGVRLVSGGLAHNPWGIGFDTANNWDQYITLDVTSVVNAWANGQANYGMFVDNFGNYNPYLSEETVSANLQPVLMIDYTPTPEPATLVLLALGGLGMVSRRMRRN